MFVFNQRELLHATTESPFVYWALHISSLFIWTDCMLDLTITIDIN